jgi:hypothetical protein
MKHVHVRNGIGEFFNSLFLYRALKSIVQVRTVRQDKQFVEEDLTNMRGAEVELRTVQFQGVQSIEEKLDELTRKGRSVLQGIC